jgi:hypothetical protein
MQCIGIRRSGAICDLWSLPMCMLICKPTYILSQRRKAQIIHNFNYIIHMIANERIKQTWEIKSLGSLILNFYFYICSLLKLYNIKRLYNITNAKRFTWFNQVQFLRMCLFFIFNMTYVSDVLMIICSFSLIIIVYYDKNLKQF